MCKESWGSIVLNWQLDRSPEWATAVVPVAGRGQLSRRKGKGFYGVWFRWLRDFWLADSLVEEVWRVLVACWTRYKRSALGLCISCSSSVQYQESLDWLGWLSTAQSFSLSTLGGLTPCWVCLQQPCPLCHLPHPIWARLWTAPADGLRAYPELPCRSHRWFFPADVPDARRGKRPCSNMQQMRWHNTITAGGALQSWSQGMVECPELQWLTKLLQCYGPMQCLRNISTLRKRIEMK